ncbi:Fatty-acid amide hydrolase 2 [Portunus trituberculatus]|uniref:Fatty-acid amide hydrolase 2 n=1 Tax=Portunus trituberculatus TaxID=210409 RepID=A0A5B7CPB2_PORTR|nr:Fatty-acid amide hydrolase 2 [Portunus trituberculatus]
MITSHSRGSLFARQRLLSAPLMPQPLGLGISDRRFSFSEALAVIGSSWVARCLAACRYAPTQRPRKFPNYISLRSAESIVEAFRRRVEAVNPIINAVVDERFEAALLDARGIDQRLDACTQEEREEIGRAQPLLGVPFTAKENVLVKGLSCTHGLVLRQGMKAERDAEVVCRLREAGAIPLAVTNVPELGMWIESSNILYGRTSNPYDVSRTPGGSSGGEVCMFHCLICCSLGRDSQTLLYGTSSELIISDLRIGPYNSLPKRIFGVQLRLHLEPWYHDDM